LPAEEPDPMEIVFITMEVDSYHLGKFFLFLNGNKPITLTFYRETKINKEAQCNGIKTMKFYKF